MWTFNTYGEAVEIEESVFLSGPDGPRRTVQIVIYGHARETAAGALELPPHPAVGAGRAQGQAGRAGIAAVVIPGRAEGANPESITPALRSLDFGIARYASAPE